MGLVQCVDCSGGVSTDAKTCPHCGSRQFTAKAKIAKGVMSLLWVTATIWIVVSIARCEKVEAIQPASNDSSMSIE